MLGREQVAQPIRPSPRRDRSSAPFLGCGVAHGLGEFPAVAAKVLKDARALAVLVGPQSLDNARTAIARAGERRIDVWHSHLEELRNDAVARRNLIGTNVGDNNGTVRSDAQLGAVRITDPYPFLKSECGLQPRHRRSYVWVDEHRSDGGGRRRTIRQHNGDSNGRRGGPGHCAQGTPHGQRFVAVISRRHRLAERTTRRTTRREACRLTPFVQGSGGGGRRKGGAMTSIQPELWVETPGEAVA